MADGTTTERLDGLAGEASPAEPFQERHESGALPTSTAAQALREQDHAQDIALKKTYARWLLLAVIGQLVLADGVFIAYASAGRAWDLDAGVINLWLAVTLVQFVGVVAVVTRHLFPRRDEAGGVVG